MNRWVLVFVFVAMLFGADARAVEPGPVGKPSGSYNEQLWWVPMEQPRGRGVVHLETTVYRPDGSGPFPMILLNHGSPGDAEDRRKNPRSRFYEQSRWFVGLGYAVVIPMRRGYANSEGEWAEGYKTCADPDYVNAGFTTANDMAAVLKYFRAQPFIQRDRIVVVGQSAGGFGSLALASRNPEGVIGIVNFAGGRGGINPGTAEPVCKSDRLVEAVTRYGKTARLPAIWLYAQNDLLFRPELAGQMLSAYRSGGAPAEFVAMPTFGRNGHETFASWSANANWTGHVKQFLAGLPAR